MKVVETYLISKVALDIHFAYYAAFVNSLIKLYVLEDNTYFIEFTINSESNPFMYAKIEESVAIDLIEKTKFIV